MVIAGITLTQPQVWLISGAAFGLAIFLLWLRRLLLRRKLFRICGVSTSDYRLVGTTLLWFGHPVRLQKPGLRGRPSTFFLSRNRKSAYICHFNPRFFNGRVKVRERYQMLLYMGLAMDIFKLETIQAAIHYQDHLEAIHYEPDIYQQLLDLRQEYHDAIKEWNAPNVRPLFNRDLRP